MTKKNTKYILSGKIEIYKNFAGAIEVGNESLSDWVSNLELEGKVVLRYYFSEKEITEERLILDYLKTLYGAPAASYWPIYGSEWTGWYADNDEFIMDCQSGNHNIVAEFASHRGEWVWLEIECFI